MREPLSNLAPNGRKVYDQKLAMRMADALAAMIAESEGKAQARAVFGMAPRRTLKDLLDEYHGKRGRKWSESNRHHQESMRRFWLNKVGGKTDVEQLAGMAAEIEAIAADVAEKRGWSPRTEAKYLKYLRTAVNFGQKKLKWYGEAHNLSALEIPSADSIGLSYETGEIRAILDHAGDVDLRCAAAAHIAYQTLRRITAIAHLRTDGWRVTTERDGDSIIRVGHLFFGRAKDKAKKSAEAVIVGDAVDTVERLIATPAVQASGWLFPEGSLKDRAAVKPIRYERLHEWLWEAERLAGVEHKHGRAWHAFKRRATTDAERVMGSLKEASKQAGTLESTLRSIYLQHDPKPKLELAKGLARHIRSV